MQAHDRSNQISIESGETEAIRLMCLYASTS